MITRFQVSISADLFRKLFLVSEKRKGTLEYEVVFVLVLKD